jgi:hypothetical protein
MMLLTHLAGLRIGEVACLRWSDVTTTDDEIKDEIRLLPDMTKGRHARDCCWLIEHLARTSVLIFDHTE